MSAVIEKDLLAPAIADDALGQAKALLGMPIRVLSQRHGAGHGLRFGR